MGFFKNILSSDSFADSLMDSVKKKMETYSSGEQSSPSSLTPPPLPTQSQTNSSETPTIPDSQANSNQFQYSSKLEMLIDMAIEDGEITEQEMNVLKRNAMEEGVDPDEIEMVVAFKAKKRKEQLTQSQPQISVRPIQTSKYGTVLKCPQCGAPVVGGDAKCRECGYSFVGLQANSSAKQLADKIEQIKLEYRTKKTGFWGPTETEEIESLIENFPIPNTREDLLEFLASLKAKLDVLGRGKVMGVYPWPYEKYEMKYLECVNKARISFKDDPDFRAFLETEQKKQKKWGLFSL